MQIQDGQGSGYMVGVTDKNQLKTLATTEKEISRASKDHSKAYAWTASVDVGADKNVLWIRNDATTEHLIIEEFQIAVSATSLVEVWVGTGNTAAGTVVTAVNLNRQSGNVALATGRHTNTNVDAGAGMTLLSSHQVVTGTTFIDAKGALILGYLDEIAFNVITDIALTTVNLLGYYTDING